MKKFLLILMVAVIVTMFLFACSKSICPAYSFNDTAQQTEVVN